MTHPDDKKRMDWYKELAKRIPDDVLEELDAYHNSPDGGLYNCTGYSEGMYCCIDYLLGNYE